MQLRKYLAAPFAALLLTGASLANAAAPIDVTWNPSAVPGVSTAGAFTFDNILLNSYAAIDITGGGTTFSEQGFVSMAAFSDNNVFTSIPTAGFPGGATPYSLYISFTAAGTQSPGIPSTGIFTSMNYSLLAAPGATTFTANASGIFAATGSPTITLATGTLNGPGSTSLTGTPPIISCRLRMYCDLRTECCFRGLLCQSQRFANPGLERRFHQYGQRDH